jgi:hypothetical protein
MGALFSKGAIAYPRKQTNRIRIGLILDNLGHKTQRVEAALRAASTLWVLVCLNSCTSQFV